MFVVSAYPDVVNVSSQGMPSVADCVITETHELSTAKEDFKQLCAQHSRRSLALRHASTRVDRAFRTRGRRLPPLPKMDQRAVSMGRVAMYRRSADSTICSSDFTGGSTEDTDDWMDDDSKVDM